jgi:flavin reductase (DIM6/NTAB) family NADH-FMN oxidoreductase RutF
MGEPDPALAAALGRIPSGVSILTARRGAQTTGMLTSWVQQCAFEPPHVSVAVKQGRPMNAWLTKGTHFILNLLAESQKNLVAHFGRGFPLEAPAFEGLELGVSAKNQPIILQALAHLECEVTTRVTVGDHDLLLARIVSGAMQGTSEPMVHLRKTGFRY